MHDKLVAPDPNKDLLRFFGDAPPFDFYGMSPKEIGIKVGELEMEQKLKLLAIEEAGRDRTGVIAAVMEIDDAKLREALSINNMALVRLDSPPQREMPLVWLQWLLANRGVEVTLDELKMRVGPGGVNEFVEKLTPPKKAVAGGS